MTIAPLPVGAIDRAVAEALREDLGDAGDITTAATIPLSANVKAEIRARKSGVIAGVDIAAAAFWQVDPAIEFTIKTPDGGPVEKGDTVATISGPARGVLTAERVALNFLGRLSGIATATSAFVHAIGDHKADIVCTRKTTPGLRAFEKYAVRCGGGVNHRFGLYDAVMIKDNHIAACGGIKQALATVRKSLGHLVKVEIEIDRLDQLNEALNGGADVIMLDNMSIDDMSRAVTIVDGAAILEASGNVTVETVSAIAATGVDVISTGWITHSAPNFDVGLDFL